MCKNCVERHIDASLNGKGDGLFIQCPFEECKKANQELFESIKNDTRFLDGAKILGVGLPKLIMKEMISCYTHEVPWHENMSCIQYEETRKESEAATNHYLMEHTKSCPKYGTHIEKNG
ncbi:hypothetical protein C2G38_2045295 [Gigaspora rosea]|uniref:Uncharacterized protein n=1 Tax=Gigaspora rosea TaxID=44941 RepID=A0A397UDM5_9GLOM|nr:hypothetical protein C2G38_2045295 [Gigaspora rosea]